MSVPNRRIVLLGKTGVGKSSLANTIFHEDVFRGDIWSWDSATIKCQTETRSVNGRNITLIDTPGFFDIDRSEEELKSEIVRCLTECAPGLHAFLIVLKVEKFTKQDQALINKIQEYFSEEAFKYATVVFTHGQQLPDGETIESFVLQNKSVSDLVRKCGGRCHVIDNRYWNRNTEDEYRSNKFQVEKLLASIEKRAHIIYTTKMLKRVQQKVQEEAEFIGKTSGNMSEEKIREEAKNRVSTRLSVRLAGTATGALLGALCGTLGLSELVVRTSQYIELAKKLMEAVKGTPVGEKAACITVCTMAGACGGYHAAEGAETQQEAAMRVMRAAKDTCFII